ncbi:MAG: prephenate dehydratase [Propionibacteriaceae bacterium]|nr:prephenate dehydratase [Propionibacteriaceae bacterium]
MLGYFGPEGTFTHQALLALRPDASARPYSSVAAALLAVRAGAVEAAVVPIENSVEGGVSATLDYLSAPDEPPLSIQAEVLVNVNFDLAVRPGTALSEVNTVITHPHAAAQCRGWLAKHLPEATIVERGSTAAAAKDVSDPTSAFDAAICAPVARELYHLVAAASDINDNTGAVTRFVLVGRPGNIPAPTGADKTTFVAYMRDNHSGALLEILQQLAVRGVNLTRIESRPTKTTLGSYCFSIDAEGHLADARVAGALQGLKRICADVVFLGSYPRADKLSPLIVHGSSDAEYATSKVWLDALR